MHLITFKLLPVRASVIKTKLEQELCAGGPRCPFIGTVLGGEIASIPAHRSVCS